MLVRVTLDDRYSERVYADLLHSYCSERDRSTRAFARSEIFYYSAIAVAFFALIALEMHFLNAQN